MNRQFNRVSRTKGTVSSKTASVTAVHFAILATAFSYSALFSACTSCGADREQANSLMAAFMQDGALDLTGLDWETSAEILSAVLATDRVEMFSKLYRQTHDNNGFILGTCLYKHVHNIPRSEAIYRSGEEKDISRSCLTAVSLNYCTEVTDEQTALDLISSITSYDQRDAGFIEMAISHYVFETAKRGRLSFLSEIRDAVASFDAGMAERVFENGEWTSRAEAVNVSAAPTGWRWVIDFDLRKEGRRSRLIGMQYNQAIPFSRKNWSEYSTDQLALLLWTAIREGNNVIQANILDHIGSHLTDDRSIKEWMPYATLLHFAMQQRECVNDAKFDRSSIDIIEQVLARDTRSLGKLVSMIEQNKVGRFIEQVNRRSVDHENIGAILDYFMQTHLTEEDLEAALPRIRDRDLRLFLTARQIQRSNKDN